MLTMKATRLGLTVGTVVGMALLLASWAGAQQILLDKPVTAGELTLFPDLNDEMTYYYVSDKPRLATDENGNPQFSFLRYVENVRTGADQPEAREGEGGGIVHAVVALDVTDEQLRDARQALQRVKPGAKIQGPVVYRSGKFGLVSSFADPKGGFTTQVVGMGSAPILDGQKAAISMQLTKLGAKVLWESFKTATPDISFTFEMEMAGYRSPHRAVIEANFDQIYDHKAFGVGIAGTYLAAEIKGAFDDLRREGAIKVTQVGGDEKLEALLTTAYNKLTEMMFAPLNGTGTPSLGSLAGIGGESGSGLLDRASRMLRDSRAEAERENERIRRENREAEERERAAGAGGRGTPGGAGSGGGGGATPAPAAGGGGAAPAAGGGGAAAPAGGGEDTPRPSYGDAQREEDTGGEYARRARPTDQPSTATRAPREERTVPSFAVVAAFEMKRIRQRGTFKIDLNKFTPDTMTLRFDENIGDLRNLMDDESHFRQVNLDDPLFRQREIVAFVDGMNATDFGQYINFVTVHMRKKHESGEITDDEVRIDRNNFNREGNNFKLLYGWKGDNNRNKWLNYQYQTTRSFFGGNTVQDPWREATEGAINLAPPYQRRSVELQADADMLKDAQVRLVTVKVHYDLAGAEQVRQASLNPSKGQLSEKIEFMLPGEEYDYEYEIIWRLTGNRTVASGRQTSSEAVLFVDEVPAT
jgi:hypothetical protein